MGLDQELGSWLVKIFSLAVNATGKGTARQCGRAVALVKFARGLAKPYEILGGSLVYGPLPIAITGVVGSRFGAAIVNGDTVSSSRQAIWQGAKIALASFFAYTIFLGFLGRVFFSLTEHTTGANRFIVVPMLFFGALLVIPVWAFCAVGLLLNP